MKLHVLGMNFAPEIISTGLYTTGMVEFLAGRGHEVTVVAGHPYYPEWRIWKGWPRFAYRSERPMPNTCVIHCPLYVPRQPTALRRILHYASFTVTAAPRLIWRALRDRPDAIIVVAPSLVSAVAGWLAGRIAGVKLWLHVQDFEVEAAFATGAFREGGRIGRWAAAFERWILTRFDMVSSISEPMLEKLAEKGVAPERIFELRNWANLQRVSVIEGESPLKAEFGITTPHVALYSGNIAGKQGIEIIPAAARLLAHRKDLTFVIIGEGPFLAELKQLAEGLGNVRFFPLQPVERLSDALGMADIHLLPQIAGVADLVLPSKLTNMLASGRPVIATTPEGTALAREIGGAGRVTPPGDEAALAAAIEQLLDAPEERARMGRQARAGAVERWDMTRILERLEAKLGKMSDTLLDLRAARSDG